MRSRKGGIAHFQLANAHYWACPLVKLTGMEELYRVRAGDYRVVYQIQDERLVVLVVRIAHRRDVYR